MHLLNQKKVYHLAREQRCREMQLRNLRRLWYCLLSMTQRDKVNRCLAQPIDRQQLVDRLINKTHYNLRWQLSGAGDCQEIGENSPIVPEGMPVSSFLVFPGIAPECAGMNHDNGCRCQGWFVGAGLHEHLPEITGAQL